MKKFPIKVEPVTPRLTNIVEWMIGNTCNFNCSFCPDDFKSGSQRFFDLSVYKTIIDKVVDESGERKTWFKITGGEPTLYPKLIDLLSYIKQKGQFTYLITNGSRTLRFWKDIKEADCLDIIAFSYHPEQTSDLQHLIDVVDLFRDTKTIITVNITCPPKFFDSAKLAFDIVNKKCATFVNLQQVNDPYGMTKYTEEQKKTLLNYSQTKTINYHLKAPSDIPKEYIYHDGILKYSYEDGSTNIGHAIKFIKNQEDNFYGYSCDIGLANVRIVYESVQRAVCGAGEVWSIYDDRIFRENPIICPHTSCTCTLDIIIPKNRVSNV